MDYKKLDVWRESRKLVNLVYESTRTFPKSEKHGLTFQIRKSSVSVTANIAEGCGRHTSKDTTRFLYMARGSLFELETQLYLSIDQRYISREEFGQLMQQIIRCKKLINGFIGHYKKKILRT